MGSLLVWLNESFNPRNSPISSGDSPQAKRFVLILFFSLIPLTCLKFRTSFANVPIGIKDLSFNGPLQIELKDLCGKVPFVSAAISYFTKPPKVDFRMTKAAEFVNNPMVSKNLKNLVSDSMKTQLLEPQRMVIPMAKSDASGNNILPY